MWKVVQFLLDFYYILYLRKTGNTQISESKCDEIYL